MSQRSVMEIVREMHEEVLGELLVPPPVFEAMRGEFVAHDLETGWLRTRFPVLEEQLNPYGTMQGGMVAAAIDNTLGPLSMMVAPPNYTRRLEVKYSRPATRERGPIEVEATFLGRDGRWLKFRAEVRDREGNLLARAAAMHWVVENLDAD